MNSRFIVAGGEGKAFFVSKGEFLTFEDLEGKQVIDFIFFNKENYAESFSTVKTKTSLNRSNLKVGDKLVSNLWNPMVEIIEDTVGIHDMNMSACTYDSYKKRGIENHKSCAENFKTVLNFHGIKEIQIAEPLNLFQKTVINEIGTWESMSSISKKGDHITFKFLEDCLCAISVCPYDLDGFNGGKSTPISVKIYKEI